MFCVNELSNILCERVPSHVIGIMSHLDHVSYQLFLIWIRPQINHVSYESIMSHLNQASYQSIISHMHHVSCESYLIWIMSLMNQSCLIWIMSHMNQSYLMRIMSHIHQTSRVRESPNRCTIQQFLDSSFVDLSHFSYERKYKTYFSYERKYESYFSYERDTSHIKSGVTKLLNHTAFLCRPKSWV